MKKRYLFVAAYLLAEALLFVSCNREESCGQPNALNYDLQAVYINDNSCVYSTITFYAGGSTFSGEEVASLEVAVEEDVLGKITTLNQEFPASCNVPGTLVYAFETGLQKTWVATYTLAIGGTVTAQGIIKPISSEECVRVNVLP